MQPTYPPPPPYQQPPMGYYPPPKKSSNTVLFIVLGTLGGVMVLGILAAVAIPSFLKYQKKTKTSEAEIQLDMMKRGLKAQFFELNGFPTESAGPTPSTPCCDSPGRKCQPDMQEWMVPPWETIDFAVDQPGYFQYSYTGDPSGKSFTATAEGDLDCDGDTITYRLEGRVGPDGAPEFTVFPPDNPD